MMIQKAHEQKEITNVKISYQRKRKNIKRKGRGKLKNG